MAEKRMFAKSIVFSDVFLDMPLSARCLYFTLGMVADDDGFVGNPKSIMRQCGASQDDMVILLQKRYVLAFESGVIVIKHWRMNNYLRSDRYTPTTYLEELSTLKVDEKGAYTEINKLGIPDGIPMVDTDKNSIDKSSKEKNIYYPDDPALNSAFEDFIAHRKKMKKPVDEYKAEGLIKKLDKLSGGNSEMAIKILKQSIDERWIGLFELKQVKKNDPNKGMYQQEYDMDELERKLLGL